MGSSYEAWQIRQLQDECRRRGLPSGRSKADLVERLAADDADVDGTVMAESDVPPRPAPEPMDPTPAAPATPGAAVFRMTHPAVRDGVDEATHLAYRLRTWEAAQEAGHQPRGGQFGARRVGTSPDGEVYEISVRTVT